MFQGTVGQMPIIVLEDDPEGIRPGAPEFKADTQLEIGPIAVLLEHPDISPIQIPDIRP